VHSTTKEIPFSRFQKAIKEGKTVLKPFIIKSPYTSTKDIFCLTLKRKAGPYRRITYQNYQIEIPKFIPLAAEIELHIIPGQVSSELRLWYKNKVIKVIQIKNWSTFGVGESIFGVCLTDLPGNVYYA
jgi:hypothetical protein